MCNAAVPSSPLPPPVSVDEKVPKPEDPLGLSEAAPFTLKDIRNAIPGECFERDTLRSFSYLVRDVAIVAALALGASALDSWFVWPLYWMAQGTMFWALFVIGHDCGHQSFSSNRTLNDFVGHLTHSSILVPYHPWRISHRTHHANHGHVENDESWRPYTKSQWNGLNWIQKFGRCSLPMALFVYPFYLFMGVPGKEHSHFDPHSALFLPGEEKMVRTSNAFLVGMLGILAACTVALGPVAMFKLYLVPYWVFVMWLDTVTYLHHHGADDKRAQTAWYRGERWNFMQGGLSTLDRDYGIFNNIHHDIGTHVVHHLFSTIPHYNLIEATESVKPVLGKYYREPEKSKGPMPVHLLKPMIDSFKNDHYVDDEGEVVFYKKGF